MNRARSYSNHISGMISPGTYIGFVLCVLFSVGCIGNRNMFLSLIPVISFWLRNRGYIKVVIDPSIIPSNSMLERQPQCIFFVGESGAIMCI